MCHLLSMTLIRKEPVINNGKDVVYGYNSFRYIHRSTQQTRHAEIDAMKKLPSHKKNRLISVSLLVIRVDRSGELKNSRPCFDCLKRLQYINRYGYRLVNIYYSDENGQIIKKKYYQLLEDNNQHISKGYR